MSKTGGQKVIGKYVYTFAILDQCVCCSNLTLEPLHNKNRTPKAG